MLECAIWLDKAGKILYAKLEFWWGLETKRREAGPRFGQIAMREPQ